MRYYQADNLTGVERVLSFGLLDMRSHRLNQVRDKPRESTPNPAN